MPRKYQRKTDKELVNKPGPKPKRYVPPRSERNRDMLFLLPDDLQTICDDLEYHGGVLRHFLNQIDEEGTYHAQILCLIYQKLEQDEEMRSRWDTLLSLGEKVQVALAKEKLMRKSVEDQDLQALKLFLTSRNPEHFGPKTTGGGGLEAMKEVLHTLQALKEVADDLQSMPDHLKALVPAV